MLDKEFVQKIKQRLEEEKVSVEEKLAQLNKNELPMDNPDLDDLANDATDDIIEESTKVAFNNVLEKINAALKRIEDGKYGICVNDGTEISKERLELEPWADSCGNDE